MLNRIPLSEKRSVKPFLTGLLTILFAVTFAASTASAQTINYTGPGGTTVTGAGYTIPNPYGSLWTVVDEWGFGRLNDANPSNNYDEQVVNLAGNDVWRLSNAVTGGGFSDQPNSPSGPGAAGESSAFLWNDRGPIHTTPTGPAGRAAATTPFFHGSFRFRSVTGVAQPGLVIPVNPIARQSDRRMVQLVLTDTGTGINVSFTEAGPGGLTFPSTTIATGLSYTDWHDIDIYIQFVDGINGNGTGNDIVRVSVNNVPVHVGTSWETFYLAFTPTRPVGAVDALAFRAAGTAVPANLGNGFYFDDVVVTTPLTRFVDIDGEVGPLGCADTGDFAFTTISAAITAAVAEDIISVCPGTYPEAVNVNKAVTILGNQAGVSACSARGAESIVGNATGAFNISVSGAIVDGFTAQGNTSGAFFGAGIIIAPNTSGIQLRNSIVQNNIVGLFLGGDDSVVSGNRFENNNNTGPANGSGIYTDEYVSGSASSGSLDNVSITGNCFINNTNRGINFASATPGTQTNISIANNTFSGSAQAISGANLTGLSITGNDIANQTGAAMRFGSNVNNVTISGNSIRDNPQGIRITPASNSSNITVNYNRIVNNGTVGLELFSGYTGTLDATNNWWGCNYGPGVAGAGCPVSPNGITGTGVANIDADPWLTLTSSASPIFIPTGGNSLVTSRVTINSAAVETSGFGFIWNGTPASFAATLGTVLPTTNTTTSGVTTTTFTAGGVGGSANVATTVDGQTTDALINVLAACADVSMGVYTPSKNELTNTSIVVPVTASQMTTRNARSADFIVTYDDAVLTYTGAAKGTVGISNLDGRDLTINASNPGVLVISLFGPREFQGAGSLVDLSFNVIGLPGTSSPLTFTAFDFNEGTPCSIKANGQVNVQSGSITGKVTFGNTGTAPFPKVVPDVDVNAVGSVPQSATTANTGIYTLSGMGIGNYTVTPTKSLDVLIDKPFITGLDASDIAVHVVGNLPQLANNQLIVADVSGNGTITSFDAAMIASFVVDLPDTGFTGTWRFIPVDRFYNDVNANHTAQDYVALLMGDVTGNWDHPLGDPFLTMDPVGEPLPISAARASASSGTAVTVPVKIGDTTGLGIRAYDFELHYDADVIEPAEMAASFAGTVSDGRVLTVNATKKGILKVVVFGANPLEGEGELLNLHFNVIGAADSRSELKWEKFRINEGGINFKADNGEVNVTAAADSGSINGRLLDPRGIGVGRTRVTVTDTQGNERAVMTSSLGYFQVSELQIGETYTVRAVARRFRFAAQQVSITEGNAVQLTMIGLE